MLTLVHLAILVFTFVSVFLIIREGIRITSYRAEIYKDMYLSKVGSSLDDIFSTFQAEQVMYMNILSIFAFGLFGYSFFSYWGIIGGIIAGYIFPKIVLMVVKARRLKKFNAQLVDGITLIANAMKAGNSLLQAIDRLTEQMPPPISQEFRLLLSEVKVGVDVEDALNNMVARIGSSELELVRTAMLISRKTGGNLIEAFNKISNTIRERDNMYGKIKSLTAQGKLQGLIVGLLPIALVLILNLIEPDYIALLFRTSIGKVLIGIMIVMEILGVITIRRIITIDV